MAIKSLAHVCIKTTDLDATADFYCGALGLQRLFDFTRKGKVIGFYMKTGNATFIEVFESAKSRPSATRRSTTCAWRRTTSSRCKKSSPPVASRPAR